MKKFEVIPVLLFLFLFAACGPKEKGKVTITVFIVNQSGQKLLVAKAPASGADTLQDGGTLVLAQELKYRSPSKPLCCPCATDLKNYTITPVDTAKRLAKDPNDPALWTKQNMIRLDYWVCRLSIEPGDIQSK